MLVTINGCSHPDSLSLLDPKLSATEKADSAFKFICRNVKKYGSLDKNPRPVWIEPDGTRIPAHTFSINGVTISVDVANGESPLLSLRRIAWKYSIAELLWIYQAASNDLVIFDQLIGKNTWEEDQKINNWWEEWAIRDKNGDYVLNEQGHPIIGACYGETVRRHNLMRKLLNNMENLRILELPILVGVSHKSMIYKLLGTTPDATLNGTTVLHTVSLEKGANILRVHEVKEAMETLKILNKAHEANGANEAHKPQ